VDELRDRDQEIVDRVVEILQPLLDEHRFELVEVVYRREGRGKILRVFLDKEGGITIDDCAEISRELSSLLDVYDFIPGKYTLEVSSPGLTRPLRKPADYTKYRGRKVKIHTSRVIEGRRLFIGRLLDFSEGVAILEVDGVRYSIPFEDIDKANLEVEF
jgi:ribosome maturation factor RimP